MGLGITEEFKCSDFQVLKMCDALYHPPVGLQKGVAEAEGRAEFRNG